MDGHHYPRPFPFPACDEAAKERIRALGEELDAHRQRVLAQRPGLSLTAMYRVLEKLRGNCRAGAPPATAAASGALAPQLTPEETATHDAGLVSVLRQLHDELALAVFHAYGWTDLLAAQDEARRGAFLDFKTGSFTQVAMTPDGFTGALAAWQKKLDAEILRRLVALNATRAAEEARGHIRYLRPVDQAPTGQTTQTGLNIPAAPKKATGDGRKAKQPWPKPLAERVAATERALTAAGKPVTPTALAKHFTRAQPADLAEILETLATLGRAHREGERFSA